MKKLKIVKGKDNPILRAMSADVKRFDSELKKFAKAMKVAMDGADGLGIAAPQVGKNIRVFIVTLAHQTPKEMALVMVNPIILDESEEEELGEEGCLSLPGLYGKVWRNKAIKVQFYNLDESRQVLELEGLDARVVQHELDHLNGVLFIDKTDKLDSAVTM